MSPVQAGSCSYGFKDRPFVRASKIQKICFLTLLLFCMVRADVHYYDFVLKEKNYTRLCLTKQMLVVNEQFPGPTIYVNKGDTVYVNVQNHGDYGVTIHWHGVKQPRNPWSDGPIHVTQCEISPKTNFTYEVLFSEEEGTLWWHAHSDWTRNTVHGAIVINPAQGTTYPFPTPDGQEVIIFGSWYTYDVNIELKKHLETGGGLPISDAYVINGQPGDFCECSKESTYRWSVDYGKTYLVKLVNANMNAEFFFAIAGHSLTVVGMDGAYLKPFVTDFVMISPGNTMDVLLSANQPPSYYYMAGRQYNSDKVSVDAYDTVNATAILQYNGNYTPPSSPLFPSSLPSYRDNGTAINFLSRLRSLASEAHPVDVPKNITTRMYVTASQNEIYYNLSGDIAISAAASLNNVTWVDPGIDVLQAYYRNLSGFYTTDFPDEPPYYYDFIGPEFGDGTTRPLKGTKVKVLEYDEEVEITFQSTNVLNGSEDHPMHLHGYSFYVVGQGHGNFDQKVHEPTYNLVDPPYLNTASLPKKGWLTVRFKANNPGVWLWHCHFDRHYTWGMNTVLIVRNGDTPETTMRDPPPYMPPCHYPDANIPRTLDDLLAQESK